MAIKRYTELKIGDRLKFSNHGGRIGANRVVGIATITELKGCKWGEDGDINAKLLDELGKSCLYRVYTKQKFPFRKIEYTDFYKIITDNNYSLWI